MFKDGVINNINNAEIYHWLCRNVYSYNGYDKKCMNNHTLVNGKINVEGDVQFFRAHRMRLLKYPFGVVKGNFIIECHTPLITLQNMPEFITGMLNCGDIPDTISFKGFPKHIEGDIYFSFNRFSNNPKHKEQYKLYLAMWLELFESVNNEERLEYINSYKYKTNIYNQNPIIPVEIMKEYGF